MLFNELNRLMHLACVFDQVFAPALPGCMGACFYCVDLAFISDL